MLISNPELEDALLSLPDKIKSISTALAIRAANIEAQVLEESKIKNEYLDPILNEQKAQYTNQKSRDLALGKKLSEDAKYQELTKDLQNNRMLQRNNQLELEYLHNLFSAYKSIAGMRGVR